MYCICVCVGGGHVCSERKRPGKHGAERVSPDAVKS